MNHRERALAAMQGLPVDRIPFIARMDLWYNYHRNAGALPDRYRNASLSDIQRDLGVGILGFGLWDISFFRLERPTQAVVDLQGTTTATRIETPYGTLTSRDEMAESLHNAPAEPARVEYLFKTFRDYDALQWFFEGTKAVENSDQYDRYIDEIGGDGLALPSTGHLPAHRLMLKYMGYETFYVKGS